MTKQERIKLNWQLVELVGERKALNRVRGPLGHGVIFVVDKDARRSELDARIEGIRTQLAAV